MGAREGPAKAGAQGCKRPNLFRMRQFYETYR